MGKCSYNWEEIQKIVSKEKLTWRDIQERYGCSSSTLSNARKKGWLVMMGKAEARRLSTTRHPRKTSEETKLKISKARRKFLAENPSKAPYLLNHHSKGPSYPERYFKDVFDNEEVEIIQEYRIKTYSLDFAHLKSKIAIEIDGDQHWLDPRIAKHDIRRDSALKKLGWITFRVP